MWRFRDIKQHYYLEIKNMNHIWEQPTRVYEPLTVKLFMILTKYGKVEINDWETFFSSCADTFDNETPLRI